MTGFDAAGNPADRTPSVPGGPAGDRPGTAEVHGDVHSGPAGGRYEGLGFANRDAQDMGERAAGAAREAMGEAREKAEEVGDRAREMAHDARNRAEEFAQQARGRVNEAVDRAENAWDQSGLVNLVRNNPVPAVAVAFGLGFLVAGRGSKRGFVGGLARKQLRGMLMGGLTAALSQEARNLMGLGGGDGELVDALRGRGASGGGMRRRERFREPSHREF